jgi:RNA polymerase-interacting CarD/CdnL/TRCF family regulator
MLAHGRLLMSEYDNRFVSGDMIFHPKAGFGKVEGLTRQARIQSVQEPVADGAETELTEEYYDIKLREGGRLLVPVSRAESLGLRRLCYGIAAVKAELLTPAENLPTDFRARAAELRTRVQVTEPAALLRSVRDLLAYGRKCSLSAGEKAWLDKSYVRLSTEAALVDRITMFEAQDALHTVVRELSLQ